MTNNSNDPQISIGNIYVVREISGIKEILEKRKNVNLYNKARAEMMKTHDCWNCRYFDCCSPLTSCQKETYHHNEKGERE